MTYYGINDPPKWCPFGHALGPGQFSLSWDMQTKRHWLLCSGCKRKTGIVLKMDSAEWQVLAGGEWVPYEP